MSLPVAQLLSGLTRISTYDISFIGDAFNFAFTPQQLLENEIIPKNVGICAILSPVASYLLICTHQTSSDGSNWVSSSPKIRGRVTEDTA